MNATGLEAGCGRAAAPLGQGRAVLLLCHQGSAKTGLLLLTAAALLGLLPMLSAAETNSLALTPTPLPSAAGSVVRLVASLAFVIALFFGGVWLFKNWQRVSRRHNKSKLLICEAQPLGPRQALYVIGYERQRFLVGSSPAGISLISALPDSAEAGHTPQMNGNPANFAAVLQHVLGRK